MKVIKYFFPSAVTLIIVALVASACTSASFTQATSTPPAITASQPTPIVFPTNAPTPTPLGGNSAQLGSLPHNCTGSSASPQRISSEFGPMAGANPLWMGSFRTQAPLALAWNPLDAQGSHDQYGWRHKLLYVVTTQYQGVVTIHGFNLSDGSPLYLGAQDAVTTGEATALVLDTRSPTIANRNDQWTQFPGGLDVPKAGCYRMDAQWQGGRWSMTFAAGTVPVETP